MAIDPDDKAMDKIIGTPACRNINGGQLREIIEAYEAAKEAGQPDELPDAAREQSISDIIFDHVTCNDCESGNLHGTRLAAEVIMKRFPMRESVSPLFKYGAFTSHSGVHLPDKIDCDVLTRADWDTLAAWVARRIGFGKVVGIETGGNKFAEALQQHCSPFGPVLIVDDVLTTGKSMEETRLQYPDAVGAVVFSRTKNIPDWIIARFVESNGIEGDKS